MTEYKILHFAHSAYQFEACYRERGLTGTIFQTWTAQDTAAQISRADVFIGSGFWRNEFLDAAPNLKYIHVGAVGYDSFDIEAIGARGIKLCNSSGINRNAVADHGMAMILSLTRQLHTARDRQHRGEWRGMISDIPKREDELAGRTLLIYGLGAIGGRLARLAKAFDMRVIGIKRDTAHAPDHVDAVRGPDEFIEALAEAARVAALAEDRIAGAGLDVFDPEPLPATSKLWGLENVIITPHTGGETQAYEKNVIDILAENLKRLASGESKLLSQIV